LVAVHIEDFKLSPYGAIQIRLLLLLCYYYLTQTEAVDMAENRLLWRLLAASAAVHSYSCKPEMMMMTKMMIMSMDVNIHIEALGDSNQWQGSS